MKLSVAIPCFNAAATIADQLLALSEQQWPEPWEIIVADNGSTDGTRNLVRSYYSRLVNLRIVDASNRASSAHARNVGAKAAKGESTLFCDADDQVGDGWLATIGEALQRFDFVASRTDVTRLNPYWLAQGLRNPQGLGLQRISYPPYLLHAGGNGLGVNRRLHERVGGFDESLPRLTDTDYCFRIQLAGSELHFVPNALVHIRYNSNSRALFRQAHLWAEYNVLLYRRYRHEVRISHPWRAYVRTWRDLIRCMPRTFHRDTRPAWMRALGTQVGLLQGAIRFHTTPVK